MRRTGFREALRPAVDGLRAPGHELCAALAGPLAGVTYGSEVHGVSDFELQGLRRGLGRVMKPSAGMRSLTSLLIRERDPTAAVAVSPVVRYSKEIWANQVRIFKFPLDFKFLREAWDSVFLSTDELSWRRVSGPISAMKLSLQRIISRELKKGSAMPLAIFVLSFDSR